MLKILVSIYFIHRDIVFSVLIVFFFFCLTDKIHQARQKLFVDSPWKLEENKFLYHQSWGSILKVQLEQLK